MYTLTHIHVYARVRGDGVVHRLVISTYVCMCVFAFVRMLVCVFVGVYERTRIVCAIVRTCEFDKTPTFSDSAPDSARSRRCAFLVGENIAEKHPHPLLCVMHCCRVDVGVRISFHTNVCL